MKQKAKSLIQHIKRGGTRKEEIERRLEEIFGNGSLQEIEGVTTSEKIVERIEEMTKREEKIEILERMRQDGRRRQREERRLKSS